MHKCPTLPELMTFGKNKIDIIGEIGDQYHRFGIDLLQDNNGTKMGAIESGGRNNRVEAIIYTVLTRWIKGEGLQPATWATLTTVLDECYLTQLSEAIRSVKGTPGEYIYLH